MGMFCDESATYLRNSSIYRLVVKAVGWVRTICARKSNRTFPANEHKIRLYTAAINGQFELFALFFQSDYWSDAIREDRTHNLGVSPSMMIFQIFWVLNIILTYRAAALANVNVTIRFVYRAIIPTVPQVIGLLALGALGSRCCSLMSKTCNWK